MQKVGSPGFLDDIDLKHLRRIARLQGVADAIEIGIGIPAIDHGLHANRIELARGRHGSLIEQQALDRRVHSDDAHRSITVVRATSFCPGCLPARIIGLGEHQTRQLTSCRKRGRLAGRYTFDAAGKVSGADITELRAYQDIDTRPDFSPRVAHIALHQDADHLATDTERIGQFLSREKRAADIDCDHDIGTHLADDIDRHIAGQPAIDQQLAIALHWGECRGHRHAGANRRDQTATVLNHQFAGLEVGRHRAKRDRQLIE